MFSRPTSKFPSHNIILKFKFKLPAQRPFIIWSSKGQTGKHKSSSKDSVDSVSGDGSSLSTLDPSGNARKKSLGKIECCIVNQAPNRSSTWSKSQNPKSMAMSGPRFEQTLFEFQPAPHAAIELSHKQPVQWSNQRTVSCDGGGGPLGHPRVFINIDKPQINVCGYCSRPFAHEHHRKHIEKLPSTPYPLVPPNENA